MYENLCAYAVNVEASPQACIALDFWSTAAYIPTVDSLLRLCQHVSRCDEFLLMLFVSELLSTVDCTVTSSMRL